MRSSPQGLGPAVAVVWTDASVPLSRGIQGTWAIELGRWAGSHAREHCGHVFRAADEVLHAEVLVRRVIVRAVVRDAGSCNGGHADPSVYGPGDAGARRDQPDPRLASL